MSEFIGPAFPPGLISVRNEEKEEEAMIERGKSTSDVSIGPQLPPHLSIAEEEDEFNTGTGAASSLCGPSLPSNSVTSASGNNSSTTTGAGSTSYGPSLPPGFVEDGSGEESEQPLTNSRIIGPSLPPDVGMTKIEEDEGDNGEKEEDDVIGPMPMMCGVNEAESSIRRRREFESRSKAMKDKLLGKVRDMHALTYNRML